MTLNFSLNIKLVFGLGRVCDAWLFHNFRIYEIWKLSALHSINVLIKESNKPCLSSTICYYSHIFKRSIKFSTQLLKNSLVVRFGWKQQPNHILVYVEFIHQWIAEFRSLFSNDSLDTSWCQCYSCDHLCLLFWSIFYFEICQ